MKSVKYYWLVLLIPILFLIQLSAQGQKLPNVQQGSLTSPSGIRVDGKLLEWDGQLQAYNHATDIFYTLSNDDANLYLTVQATKARVIDKIIDVGLTFVVNYADKKTDDAKTSISVTYPHLDVANGQRIIINAGKKAKPEVAIPVIRGRPVFADTTDQLPKRTDSLVKVANNLLHTNARVISLKGIPEIADDTLSVYNEQGIRTAANFDREGNYTYELAVPLKYLHLPANDQKFSYSIKILGRLEHPKHGIVTRYIYRDGHAVDVDQDLDSTTDFWAEYTLAKNK